MSFPFHWYFCPHSIYSSNFLLIIWSSSLLLSLLYCLFLHFLFPICNMKLPWRISINTKLDWLLWVINSMNKGKSIMLNDELPKTFGPSYVWWWLPSRRAFSCINTQNSRQIMYWTNRLFPNMMVNFGMFKWFFELTVNICWFLQLTFQISYQVEVYGGPKRKI